MRLQFQPTGFDLRQVQDVVDDLQQVVGRVVDLLRAGRQLHLVDARRAAIRCARPMMAFIGVRISWLMLARKALLARLASSA